MEGPSIPSGYYTFRATDGCASLEKRMKVEVDGSAYFEDDEEEDRDMAVMEHGPTVAP